MIEIITNDGCGKCNEAKNLLAARGVSYREIKMGVDITREEIIATFPNAKSFPVISVNGQFIGGLPELLTQVTEQGDNFGKTLIQG